VQIGGIAVAVLLLPLVAHAHPSWSNLGSYERQALAALAEATGGRTLDFEPEPEGKLIASIQVRNLNVFRRNTSLAWANYLHRTSTDRSVRQELTFSVGDRYAWSNVQQSLRLLRNPYYSSLAVIVPLRSERPGYVDILVVTRDRWSLRTNAEFEVQNGKITGLEALPADNNFLGMRKRLAIEILANQGDYSIGPRYIDPNVMGKRWQLESGASLIFNRGSDALEGGKVDSIVEYPLYTLWPSWGGRFALDYKSFVFREFEDESVRMYQDSQTGSLFPYEYRLRTTHISAELVRQFRYVAVHRLTAGYRLGANRPRVRGSFTGTLEERERFENNVLPRSERTSGVYGRYDTFKPEYRIYRNVDSYDLPEERQIGPRSSIELSTSAELFGATEDFGQLAASIGWWIDFRGQAYLDANLAVTTRFGGGIPEDNGMTAGLKLATAPFWKGRLRVVARGELAFRLNDEDNVRFAAGGDTGLRGYPVGAFLGRSRVLGNVELRTQPYKVWFMRGGALLFWDSGHAAEKLPRIVLHNDVGVGIRLLIPQVSSELFRLDWAFPMTGGQPEWPGRITAGFEHIF
jgi:hypothetical protein